MPLLPFQPDVLKHVVQRVTVGSRYQIDSEACIILNARLAGVDGNVTVTVYTDRNANYVSDNPSTADSEEGLIALSANAGSSDSQNAMAPPVHADYGLFCKAEGTADKEALLELTYVHRADYERSFRPIKVESVTGTHGALDIINSLPNVPIWEEGVTDPDSSTDANPISAGIQDASGLITPIGETADQDPPIGAPAATGVNEGGQIYFIPEELEIIEGQTDTFAVRLDSDYAPLKDVVLSVTSAATGDLTVSPSTLTFTPSNYTTKQNVTITAVNDADTETKEAVDVTLSVSTSDDGNYTALTTPDRTFVARVKDTDSNTAGININVRSLNIVEGADAQTIKVSLTRQPSADVTVRIGNVTSDGRWEAGVSSSYAATKDLTFTNANWLTAQAVTVRATANTTEESDNPLFSALSYQVTASSDSNYSNLIGRAPTIPVLVYDNDAPNFSVGTFILQAEQTADNGELQLLTTESGNAFIRTE